MTIQTPEATPVVQDFGTAMIEAVTATCKNTYRQPIIIGRTGDRLGDTLPEGHTGMKLSNVLDQTDHRVSAIFTVTCADGSEVTAIYDLPGTTIMNITAAHLLARQA